jgi:hypothetical protein
MDVLYHIKYDVNITLTSTSADDEHSQTNYSELNISGCDYHLPLEPEWRLALSYVYYDSSYTLITTWRGSGTWKYCSLESS